MELDNSVTAGSTARCMPTFGHTSAVMHTQEKHIPEQTKSLDENDEEIDVEGIDESEKSAPDVISSSLNTTGKTLGKKGTVSSRRSTRLQGKDGDCTNKEKKCKKTKQNVGSDSSKSKKPKPNKKKDRMLDETIEKVKKLKTDGKSKKKMKSTLSVASMSVADDLCINVDSIVNVMPTLMPCLQVPNIPLKSKEVDVDVETVARRYECIVCLESFDKKLLLVNHMRIHSSHKGGFTCSICDKSCNTLSNLRAHRQTHSEERPYRCDKCDAQFKVKSYLKRHMFSHNETKQFTCVKCNKNFTHKGSLKHHFMIHTGEKPHKCAHCDKTFLHTSSLKSHESSHTGIKPFVCNVCQKGFPRMYGLKVHLVSHSNEKPFKCKVCSKGFKRNDHLREHLITHDEKKPYECDTCGKTFSQNVCLRKHLPCREHERYQRRNIETNPPGEHYSEDGQPYQPPELTQPQVILTTEPNSIMYYSGVGGEIEQSPENSPEKEPEHEKVGSPTNPLLPLTNFLVQDQTGSVIDPHNLQFYATDLSGARVVIGPGGGILMHVPQWQGEGGIVTQSISSHEMSDHSSISPDDQTSEESVSCSQNIESSCSAISNIAASGTYTLATSQGDYTESSRCHISEGITTESLSTHSGFTLNVAQHDHTSGEGHSQEVLTTVPGIDSLSCSGISNPAEDESQWIGNSRNSNHQTQCDDLHSRQHALGSVDMLPVSKDETTVPVENVQMVGPTGHSDISQVLFSMIEETGTLQSLEGNPGSMIFSHPDS